MLSKEFCTKRWRFTPGTSPNWDINGPHARTLFIFITRAERHRVIKWALFLLSPFCLFADFALGHWLVRGLMTRSLLVCWSRVRESTVGRKMSTSDVCFACLAWLYELFVGTLRSLTNLYTGFIERFDVMLRKGPSKRVKARLNE